MEVSEKFEKISKIVTPVVKAKMLNLINQHVANGGSIYDGRRQLNYYKILTYYIKKCNDIFNESYTIYDLYDFLGISFDREYNKYQMLLDKIQPVADKDGFVDNLKSITGIDCPKRLLAQLSGNINCSPSDYLFLMTPYRYKVAFIKTDYIAHLYNELHKAFPNGDLTNIKQIRPDLYEKLRHVFKYSPIPTTMNDLINFFGMIASNFESTNTNEDLFYENEKKIINKLLTKFNNDNISDIATIDPALYFQITRLVASKNMQIAPWLSQFGLKMKRNLDVDRFSRTKVNYLEREHQLREARKQVILEHSFPQPKNEVEKFQINKQIAILTLEKLNALDSISIMQY